MTRATTAGSPPPKEMSVMRAEPSALAIFLRAMRGRAYPRWRSVGRDKSWVFVEIAVPLAGTIAMVYVYKGLHAPDRFLGFAVMGGAMLAYWSNVLWAMGAQLYWDRSGGNLELYAIAPCSFVAILAGMAVGGILTATSRAVAIIVLASLLFQVHYAWSAVPATLGIFLLALVALYCMGTVMASLFLFYTREVWHLGNAMQDPVYFLGGFYFPVHSLGAVVGGMASLLPLTLGLDAMRQLLLPGAPSLLAPGWEALALAVQIVVYGVLSRLALQYLETRSRREGRLIMRNG